MNPEETYLILNDPTLTTNERDYLLALPSFDHAKNVIKNPNFQFKLKDLIAARDELHKLPAKELFHDLLMLLFSIRNNPNHPAHTDLCLFASELTRKLQAFVNEKT